MDNPALVMNRLAEIENALAEKQNALEQAAGDLVRAKRDYEHRHATVYLTTEGTVAERQATTLIAIAAGDSELYDRLTDAEADYDSLTRVVRVLDTRASIGMAILKAQSRNDAGRLMGVA